jgi:LacI family transcriptional regulator
MDRPDAIFAANDLLALGAARAAAQSGLVLGHDLGLVGYDDIDAVQWTAVPITSVAQPEAEVGREAARRLIAMARGDAGGPDVRLEPRLVVRASSLCPDSFRASPGARILPFPRSKETP